MSEPRNGDKSPFTVHFIALYGRISRSLRNRSEEFWQRSNHRTDNYLTYLTQALLEFRQRHLKDAVRLAYWALFSLFPVLVLSILVATFIFGIRNVKVQVYIVLSQMIPDSVSVLVRDSIDQVVARRATYSLFSVVSLIFGSTRLFTELQSSLSHIFRDHKLRPWPYQILLGLLMILTLTFLSIGSVNLSAWLKAINQQIAGRNSPLVGLSAALALIITNTTTFTLLFRYIPRRKIRWSALIPAAFLGGIAYELSRGLFDWYLLHVANFGLVYGSVGAVIGLLTWMFLLGCIVLFCAEFAVANDDWSEWRLEQVWHRKHKSLKTRVIDPVLETGASNLAAEPQSVLAVTGINNATNAYESEDGLVTDLTLLNVGSETQPIVDDSADIFGPDVDNPAS